MTRYILLLVSLVVPLSLALYYKEDRVDIKQSYFKENTESHAGHKAKTIREEWFTQRLDHFSPTDPRTWRQRYFINDALYKEGGPVFILIEGETEANEHWMNEGAWIEFARQTKALCIYLEHRFYGQSRPTKDLSLRSLAFLSSDQALADIATFTSAMRQKFNLHNNKWVAFGCSYAGNLVTWFRMKFPHLVDIAVASSAPLLAQLNFKEYLGVVTDAIEHTDPACNREIRNAVRTMERILRDENEWWQFEEYFNLCEKFDGRNHKDVSALFKAAAENFKHIAQYNRVNRGFLDTTANVTLKQICDIMTSQEEGVDGSSLTAFERYAEVNDLMLDLTGSNCTQGKYQNFINGLRNESWEAPDSISSSRQWRYQACADVGVFQSTDLDRQPFGKRIPLEYYVEMCEDVYGKSFNQDYINSRVHWTNVRYGGKKLQVTRVIFLNGSNDPWSVLGITSPKQTTEDNVVIFIRGAAHCADMFSAFSNELPQIRDAKEKVLIHLKEWLDE